MDLLDLDADRLHAAAQSGDATEVRRLIAEGADLDAFDDLGHAPLHYAAEGEHLAVVRILLEAGANVDAQDESKAGDTPLGHVAQTCSADMARALLAAGADPGRPGWMSVTPLYRARQRKRPEGRRVAAMLAEAHANPGVFRRGHGPS